MARLRPAFGLSSVLYHQVRAHTLCTYPRSPYIIARAASTMANYTQLNGTPTTAAPATPPPLSYLSASQASTVDTLLMGPKYGYTLDALMELAGLGVAHAVADFAPRADTARVCVVCGPGNNGGDGLVAARHLCAFGYHVSVVYPKRPQRAPFPGLVLQLAAYGVKIGEEVHIPDDTTIIVDAIFGFSFRGPAREPFAAAIKAMNDHGAPVLCVDVPSGWDVNKGESGGGVAVLEPAALISLTTPKTFALEMDASVTHYLGGRFVPPRLCEEMQFSVPPYPGQQGIVRIR